MRGSGKITATANVRIDLKKYGRLLRRMLPMVIETEEENERMLIAVEQLMGKGEDNLTPEESRLFKLMVRLIEDFEERAYSIPDAKPHEVLQHLIEARDLRQIDLLPIFRSRGYTSDIVNGKRGISKEHAKELGQFFHVSPELFL
jgi:HTH-type transcriptional regulator/antitoxin HigA